MASLGTAQAEIVAAPTAWSVAENFRKNAEVREALSGAACAAGTQSCIVVNDEKKYAQFFSIDGTSIVPGALIRLLPDEIDGAEMKEIDAESAAYAPPAAPGDSGYIYVAGSHGRARMGALHDSAFVLLRFPVDSATGLPGFAFGDEATAPEIERTAMLRRTIRDDPALSPLAEEPLGSNGVSIEGMAVDGPYLLFGLRGPCLEDEALVLRARADSLFGAEAPGASLHRLALGANAGIRDMAAVDGGFLILAGRSDDDRSATEGSCAVPGTEKALPIPSIWFWDGAGTPVPLGTVPGVTKDDKLETLLVLGRHDEGWRVLVLFEGVENGQPTEYEVRR